jgi:DNA polymerase
MNDLAVHIDFETRSAVDLTKAGVYRYAEDRTTATWGFRYRFGEHGDVDQWRPGWPDPVRLLEHVRNGGKVVCHNAAFERTIWNWVIRRDYPHWPVMTIQQQDCTMSRAAAIAYPQKLEKLGEALRTHFRKDMAGHALMMKMAKPRRHNADGTITWWDDPADIDRNMEYCADDVRTETNVDIMLPPLAPASRRDWEFDQLINDRGVGFDMAAVRRAADLVDYAKKQNDVVMRNITDRTVKKCSNDAMLLQWLNGRGVYADSLSKGEVENVVFLAATVQDKVALDAIKLRQAAWKTSTAKYKAMTVCANSDNSIRGLLNWHGASTGRRAGRLVQPQNFPRVDQEDQVLVRKMAYLLEMLLDHGIDIREVYDRTALCYGHLDVLDLLSKMLRAMIIARKGKKLVDGDFSNIEGRVNAWLAGEQWKLDAFELFDMGIGPDLYKLAYARSFGVDVESVGKGQKRQIGKVSELALGFQGGVGSYISMGANYGVNPFDLSAPVRQACGPEQWRATEAQYEAEKKAGRSYGLFPREWTALKILVENWRAAHPSIVQSWWDYQDAAIDAVAAPGTVTYCAGNRVQYYSDRRYLWCILPSGRMLCYAEPELVQTERVYFDKVTGERKTRMNNVVYFQGVDSKTHQWSRQNLYGGNQCNNVVQATAADLLIDAMFNLEAAGFPVILTVHDEILAEPDEDRDDLNADYFAEVMSQLPSWATGLPVAVSAWEDKRYVK